MKQTILTGFTLTLLMLLLVLVAAFIFLFRGRQTLEERVVELNDQASTLQQELSQTGASLTTSEATRSATETNLATAESNNITLEGELVASQQREAELEDTLATQTAALEDANQSLAQLELERQESLQQPPLAILIAPEDESLHMPDEPVDFIIAASDLTGLTAVNLTINDETIGSYTIEDERIFAVTENWQTNKEGPYTVNLMAVNVNGIASEPVTATIQIMDVEARNKEIRETVEANVIEIRGLTPTEPISPTLLTQEELREEVESEFAEETTPEDSRQSTLVLSAFDFVEPDFDLYQALIDIRSDAVAGYYDPQTARFVVVSDENNILTTNEQWTHAHEFVHALQDQYFPLELIADNTIDSEASAALRAVAEGEATLVQYIYLFDGYFSQEQAEEIFAEFENDEDEDVPCDGINDELPPILCNNLAFPYTAGFEFILEIYNGGNLFAPGDFAAIDAVWDNLPQSTEQILHPDRYFSGDLPIPVALPPLTNTLGTTWQQLDQDILGEFFLREYLIQQLSEAAVELAATGWGGDQYAVYWRETDDALVMVYHLVWDSLLDGTEFANLYADYPASLYGATATLDPTGTGECWQGDDVICFYPRGEESLIVRAPDVETAVLVAQRIGFADEG